VVHCEFASRYSRSSNSFLMPFRLIEVTCAPLRYPRPSKLNISPADYNETLLLLSHMCEHQPLPYVQALDLTVETVDMVSLRRDFVRAGLRRDRCIITARWSQAPVAFAILESADSGMNLFSLYDSVRLVPLNERGRDTFAFLLEEARVWFSKQGKERFVCFFEADESDYLRHCGLSDLGPGWMVIVSAKLVPAFLENINEVGLL
jgi:hypothetical protein